MTGNDMQEHIKRLAAEAGFATDDEWYWGLDPDVYVGSPGSLERFAQAVARNCAEICRNRAKDMEGFTEEEHASQACADAIRARFGLEG